MSTEICINYSDEISRYNDWFSDDKKSYSNLDVHEKALLKEALSGNVKKEYDLSVLPRPRNHVSPDFLRIRQEISENEELTLE